MNMTEFLAELIGTMILIIFGAGVVAGVVLKDSKAENGGWIVVTIAWGLAVTMGVYAVGSFSGAHLNPAVTLGFAAVGDFPWAKVPVYIIAQILGAIIGQRSSSSTTCHIGNGPKRQKRNLQYLRQFLQSAGRSPIWSVKSSEPPYWSWACCLSAPMNSRKA